MFPPRLPPGHPGGYRSLRLRETEALAESLQTQFQPMTVLSAPAVNEMVDVALKFFFPAPPSELNLTKRDEVQEAIGGLKVGKAPSQTVFRLGP